MVNKTINLEITGEEAIINSAMDAFVKQNGWKDTDSLTKEQKAREVLRAFIMETVTAYNIQQAQQAAREVAASQTAQALDLTTMVLTVQ